jgi:hypothetical protein
MAQPTPNNGAIQQAAAEVESAMQVLTRAMARLPVGGPEWAAINKALTLLAKPFGQRQAADLVPAQIMQLAQSQQASPLMAMLNQQRPTPQGAPQ